MQPPLLVARPDIGEGLVWLKEGWRLFKRAPIPWMGMSTLTLLALMLIAQVPYAGVHLIELLSPLLVAGFMSASRAAAEEQPVTFLELGAGLNRTLAPSLLVVGGIYLVGSLLAGLAMRAVGGEGLPQMLVLTRAQHELSPEQAQALLDQALPVFFIGLLLLTPVLMANWFAPALVLFAGFSPLNSLWWSLWACAVNWRPLLFYSLIMGPLGLLAVVIPFGIGLLLFIPLVMISTYAAYRSLFVPRTEA